MRQFWMLLAGVVFAGTAMAAEKTEFGADQAAFTTVTAPAMGGVGADADALTSMKGTGKVRIGGDVLLRYTYARMTDERKPFGPTGASSKDSMYASNWDPDTMNLNFQVDACDGGKLFVSLDFTDSWDSTYTQDDILDQVYFTLENLCGTGFGVTFGKTDIPFGMGRDDLALHPYMSGFGETFLQGTTRNGDWWSNPRYNYEMPHSVTLDPRFAVIPFFKLGDTLKVEVAMFQDMNDDALYAGLNSGRYQTTSGRYTNDPGISFAGRATWNPIEDLSISGSVVTRYNKDADSQAGYGTDRTYATSLGFDWNPCFFSKKFNVFAEWQHAWDPEFIDDSSSDNIYAGLSFDVTEAITVFAQYEWLRSRNKANVGGVSDYYTQLNRAIIAGQYTFASGMYLEAGYQREWGKGTGIVKGYSYADIFYTAFGWSF